MLSILIVYYGYARDLFGKSDNIILLYFYVPCCGKVQSRIRYIKQFILIRFYRLTVLHIEPCCCDKFLEMLVEQLQLAYVRL